MPSGSKSPPIVLVTGAGRGLGRGIALELARAGMSIAVHFGGSEAGAKETAERCADLAPSGKQSFVPIQADLSDDDSRRSLVPAVIEQLGHLDALVNNAGITEPNRRDCLEAAEEDYDTVMGINLRAPYFLCQAAARYMVEHADTNRLPHYQILNISSISSDTVSTNRGAYCISKAGLSMATQLWAARLAEHGILVNDLRPGIMESDMTAGAKEKYDKILAEGDLVPLSRWGTGEDLGKATAALLTGAFPFTTGHVIPIDGGFHLRRL
jgi:NAD(P)-dependent dehydrogenase (short-subunit alcohol dehydrogenase family)